MLRVDWRTSATLVGTVLRAFAVPLVATGLVAVRYREPAAPFLLTAALSLVLGVALERFDVRDLGRREAFLMVAVVWLAVGVVGALPLYLAGTGTFADPVNALFESMSGITTTGATVIEDFDAHGRAVLLWRGVLQWLGGLGILVLAVGLLSQLSVGGAQLMETESQTTDVRKLTPRIADTARIIGGLYGVLTAATVALLYALHVVGLAPNVTLYDAVAHALTSISTAGFSPEAQSVGAYSPAVQWALVPVMAVGATNFVLLYALVTDDVDRVRGSEELRFYLGVLAGGAALVAGFLWIDGAFGTTEATVRHAVFQVVSIVTTTGYATVDFDLWTNSARHVLFVGMFVGGMAGSTTCSVKTLRWLVVFKAFRRELFTEVHPEAVRPVRLSGQVVDEETIRDIFLYVQLVVVSFVVLTLLVVVDAARVGLAITEFEAMSAVAATFLNIGPAFGLAGPYGSYADFPASTKLVMTVAMWVGRIEIIPVFVLVTATFWRS